MKEPSAKRISKFSCNSSHMALSISFNKTKLQLKSLTFSNSLTLSLLYKENPQKLTQLSPRSHPRHLVGQKTAQKDAVKDITSDSQVNSNFPNRGSCWAGIKCRHIKYNADILNIFEKRSHYRNDRECSQYRDSRKRC